MRTFLPYFLAIAFGAVMLFGVSLTAPMSHDMNCPFASGCVAAVEHLDHWQSAFAAVAAELLVLAAIVVVFFLRTPVTPSAPQYQRYRSAARTPARPPLLQELFSQGILHRKEPQVACMG